MEDPNTTPPVDAPADPGAQEDLAGVPDGTVINTVEGQTLIKEKVVYDTDEDGNQIGWHKEAA